MFINSKKMPSIVLKTNLHINNMDTSSFLLFRFNNVGFNLIIILDISFGEILFILELNLLRLFNIFNLRFLNFRSKLIDNSQENNNHSNNLKR